MQLLWFLLIGFIAGWLASQVIKGRDFGAFGNTALGVVGAYLGNWVFGLLGFRFGGTLGMLIAAFAGAVLLLLLLGLFGNDERDKG